MNEENEEFQGETFNLQDEEAIFTHFVSLPDDEKQELLFFIKAKSLRKWCFHYYQEYWQFPRPLQVAGLADTIQKEIRLAAIYETAKALGYKILTKRYLTDYRRRRTPKAKLGHTALYLVPKDEVVSTNLSRETRGGYTIR